MRDMRAVIKARSIPEPNTGCWLWEAYSIPQGYGRVWDGRTVTAAHRASYVAFNGAIPDGLEIDHRCKQPCCVNPDHLEAVAHRENMRRSDTIMGLNSRKTHCLNGHPLKGDNLTIVRGMRRCRICINARQSKYGRQKRARFL